MNEGHLIFGEVLCNYLDIPIDLHNWAKIPDAKFYKPNEFTNFLFHRWTLHGFANIDTCIVKGVESDKYRFEKKYEEEIRCLIASHTFLDLFNGPIVPSYPDSSSINLIPRQLPKYLLVALNDPADDDLREVFTEIVSEYECAPLLAHDFEVEYRQLPMKEGDMVRRIRNIY